MPGRSSRGAKAPLPKRWSLSKRPGFESCAIQQRSGAPFRPSSTAEPDPRRPPLGRSSLGQLEQSVGPDPGGAFVFVLHEHERLFVASLLEPACPLTQRLLAV